MNFEKRSKTVLVVTAIFTAAVCFCFIAAGAYVAPSDNGGDMITEDKNLVLDTVSNIENDKGGADREEMREENIMGMLEGDGLENNHLTEIPTLATVYVQSQGEYCPVYIYETLPDRTQKTNNVTENIFGNIVGTVPDMGK